MEKKTRLILQKNYRKMWKRKTENGGNQGGKVN